MDSRIVTKEDSEEGVVFSQTGRLTPQKGDSPVFKRDHPTQQTGCFEELVPDKVNDERLGLRGRKSSFADMAKM